MGPQRRAPLLSCPPILASWFPGALSPPARDYVNTAPLLLPRTIFALRIWEGCYGDWGRAAGGWGAVRGKRQGQGKHPHSWKRVRGARPHLCLISL